MPRQLSKVLRKPRLNYTRAVVTYLDVLGFREIINTRSAVEVADILSRFQRRSEPYIEAQAAGHTAYGFSDLVVRIAPLGNASDSLAVEAADIAAAQSQLSQRGILCAVPSL